MKRLNSIFLLALLFVPVSLSQDFDFQLKGRKEFNLRDSTGRNQAVFYSEAPYENVTGLANDVWGNISFDAEDFRSTLKGEIYISTASIKTGIKLRDEQLQSLMWLNSEKYPVVSFRILEVKSIDVIEDNHINAVVTGEFTLCGRTKLIYASAKIKLIQETPFTKKIREGNLINISAKFDINLSDFKVNNAFIGDRVSDKILITANLIGSDAYKNK